MSLKRTTEWVSTKAPYRIDLCGGPTDVLYFAREETGYVVNAAIDRYANSHVRYVESNKLILNSMDFGVSQTFQDASNKFNLSSLGLSHADPKVHLLLACAMHEGALGGIEIVTNSDFSPKSGLGGSASLAVSLLGALRKIRVQTH